MVNFNQGKQGFWGDEGGLARDDTSNITLFREEHSRENIRHIYTVQYSLCRVKQPGLETGKYLAVLAWESC